MSGSEDGEMSGTEDEGSPEKDSGPRLVSYETDDGEVVVCEATNPTAWIKTDAAVDADAEEAEISDVAFP